MQWSSAGKVMIGGFCVSATLWVLTASAGATSYRINAQTDKSIIVNCKRSSYGKWGCGRCGNCHNDDIRPMTLADADKHFSVHFPKSRHLLQEGSTVPIEGYPAEVSRENGALYLVESTLVGTGKDQKKRTVKTRLPSTAMLVKGRSGGVILIVE